MGAGAALERASVQRMLHGAVRSTATAAPAAMSALVRTRLQGAVREPVDGEAGTGDARSVEVLVTMQSRLSSTVLARQRRRAQRAGGQASARSARRARRREGSQ
ncbi:MAG: hypothetical protein OXN81_10515, partial [Alphaproteobacteria bacterium]|nr:hypothetical protein [Alphaproteobacteria bacterium]